MIYLQTWRLQLFENMNEFFHWRMLLALFMSIFWHKSHKRVTKNKNTLFLPNIITAGFLYLQQFYGSFHRSFDTLVVMCGWLIQGGLLVRVFEFISSSTSDGPGKNKRRQWSLLRWLILPSFVCFNTEIVQRCYSIVCVSTCWLIIQFLKGVVCISVPLSTANKITK